MCIRKVATSESSGLALITGERKIKRCMNLVSNDKKGPMLCLLPGNTLIASLGKGYSKFCCCYREYVCTCSHMLAFMRNYGGIWQPFRGKRAGSNANSKTTLRWYTRHKLCLDLNLESKRYIQMIVFR
ncbi:hypothetical protein BABINDRAFT_81774 [Babjeviella inositovora NRRL Y-12698]|uniref:Uncharacterized protein n=1 Tax=Babjeviella inositovora NRRL Y-12698 TaxID=984486 RepID=A0A1E3R1D0_9ASCO|nr:uncharacterized protein BABINDRAFT_81774 [Babjeviella inositovora NRRL Y-12698]ODQ83172.1 hypothetical protein BABINDRAFT_81774 [Babjeviella inositovora NRRL Y-12698]